MRCRECRTLLELQELPVATGESGGVRVEIVGVRAGRCASPDHAPEPPYPDFAADLVAAVEAGEAFPASVSRGWLRRRPCCGRCGEDLGGVAVGPGEVLARLRLERAAPLTVCVEGPVVECGECRLLQLHRETTPAGVLGDAVLDALDSAGLAPAGSARGA
jgi:hypothetical protein